MPAGSRRIQPIWLRRLPTADIGMHKSILERIGNTSLIALRRIVPPGHARVLIKMESENPTGSMKDRMALAMIEAAEADGRLAEGGPVVEYTGGSTGVSLALVCGVKGYPLKIVTSDAFSREKRDHMAALGADLTLVPSIGGGMDERLTREMIATARRIHEQTGGFWTDQLNNPDPIANYRILGHEIRKQTEGRIDAFVHSIGTAGSLRGVGEALREYDAAIQVIAVEPSESAVLSGEETGVHRIEGIGAGFVVPLWDPAMADDVVRVSTATAMGMARRLAREEGIFAGTSTGANVAAALTIAERFGPKATVVTLAVDSGIKYLSTELYCAATDAAPGQGPGNPVRPVSAGRGGS